MSEDILSNDGEAILHGERGDQKLLKGSEPRKEVLVRPKKKGSFA